MSKNVILQDGANAVFPKKAKRPCVLSDWNEISSSRRIAECTLDSEKKHVDIYSYISATSCALAYSMQVVPTDFGPCEEEEMGTQEKVGTEGEDEFWRWCKYQDSLQQADDPSGNISEFQSLCITQ